MIFRTIIFLIAFNIFLSYARAEDTNGYVEMGVSVRQHDYDFDLNLNGARYQINNRASAGYNFAAGWNLTPNWQIFSKYVNHDQDNADGIILANNARVQGPIFYEYEQAQLGVQYSHELKENIWLETSLAYQWVDQSARDFFVELDGYTFGLQSRQRNSGLTEKLGLRFDVGALQLRPFVGYDPHAALEISADDVSVDSSWFYGARADYQFNSHWLLGLEGKTGKVSDVSLNLRYNF